MNRRHFLLSAACASASVLSLRAEEPKKVEAPLRVGAIGIAGQGFGDLREFVSQFWDDRLEVLRRKAETEQRRREHADHRN